MPVNNPQPNMICWFEISFTKLPVCYFGTLMMYMIHLQCIMFLFWFPIFIYHCKLTQLLVSTVGSSKYLMACICVHILLLEILLGLWYRFAHIWVSETDWSTFVLYSNYNSEHTHIRHYTGLKMTCIDICQLDSFYYILLNLCWFREWMCDKMSLVNEITWG